MNRNRPGGSHNFEHAHKHQNACFALPPQLFLEFLGQFFAQLLPWFKARLVALKDVVVFSVFDYWCPMSPSTWGTLIDEMAADARAQLKICKEIQDDINGKPKGMTKSSLSTKVKVMRKMISSKSTTKGADSKADS